MGRPKKVNAEGTPTDEITTNATTEDIIADAEGNVSTPRETFIYLIPETREDYLALHQCLKDLGVNSTSDLEVRASRL